MVLRVSPMVYFLRPWAALGLLLGIYACGSGTDLPRDVEPLLQTESLEYELSAGSIALSTEIPYSFENRTGGVVYLVNCNGHFALVLQRLEGEQWVTAWGPVLNDCLSPPIVIAQGEVFADTVHVWGALPGTNAYPRFDVAQPAGVYRILWVDALASFQDHLPFGPQVPEEYRISNRFFLVTD